MNTTEHFSKINMSGALTVESVCIWQVNKIGQYQQYIIQSLYIRSVGESKHGKASSYKQ